MKKILLVGKFTDDFREMNKSLSDKYEMRACVNKLEIFKGMFKLNKPDAVVILLNEMNEINESILVELQTEHSEIPVVCVGIRVEDKKIEELGIERFEFLTVPYTLKNLIEKVEYVLENKDYSKITEKESAEKESTEKESVEKEAEKEEKDGSDVEEKESGSPKRTPAHGRKTILLIDDSGIFLRTLNGLLCDEYDIKMATSCQKALVSICEKKPDLILLDYEMPVCNGRETMIKIRESESNKNIPIVFVTAVNKKEHIKSVLALKPDGYLLKPINRDKLFKTIREIIG